MRMDVTTEAKQIETCSLNSLCNCLRCISNRCGWSAAFYNFPSRCPTVVCPPALLSPVLLVAHEWSLLSDWRLKLKTFSLPTVAEEDDLVHALDLLRDVYENNSLRTDARLFTWTANNLFANEIAVKMALTLGCDTQSLPPLQQALDYSNKDACSRKNNHGVLAWINEATQSGIGNATQLKFALDNSMYTAARFAGELKGDYTFDSSTITFTDIDGEVEHLRAMLLSSTEIIVEQFFTSVTQKDGKKWKASILRITLPLVDGSRLAFVTPESSYLGRVEMENVMRACSEEAFYMSETLRLHEGEVINLCFPDDSLATSVDVLSNFGVKVNETYICSSAALNYGGFRAQARKEATKSSDNIIALEQPFLFAHLSKNQAVLLCGQFCYPPVKRRLECG